MASVKKELLEHLIRECVKELLEQVDESKFPIKFKKDKLVSIPIKKNTSEKKPLDIPAVKPGTGGGLYKRNSVLEDMNEITLSYILDNMKRQVQLAKKLDDKYKEPLYKTLAVWTEKLHKMASEPNPNWKKIHNEYSKLEKLSFELAKKYGINEDPGFLNDSYETIEDEMRLGMEKKSHFDFQGLTNYSVPPDDVEEVETVGAPAPPAAGQGTADQPAIPKRPSFTEKKLKEEWINTKDGRPMSAELNELKRAIKSIVREVFSE